MFAVVMMKEDVRQRLSKSMMLFIGLVSSSR